MRPDFGVYIGRFQPFHNGHLHVMREALARCNEVIVVLGSSNEPRSIKNPFTDAERETMIRASLDASENARVRFTAVENSAYNDTEWATDVVCAVQEAAWRDWVIKRPARFALVGHTKDESSFYLRMFPQWEFMEVVAYKWADGSTLNATQIRDNFLRGAFFPNTIPAGVADFLKDFRSGPDFARLMAERAHIDTYRKAWEAAPYPPTFVTVDACVVQAGHVLLIERRAEPGKGLWALPGGFLDGNERIEAAVLRELREETKLRVPEAVLRGSIVTTKVFDAPDRSMRGRTITHASLIHLQPHGDGLPEVKGSSDARKARWWPLAEVKRSMMFEDHMDILRALTALL
jgi:bifunctional NMN adenylyltransferase/nudix hydrolase